MASLSDTVGVPSREGTGSNFSSFKPFKPSVFKPRAGPGLGLIIKFKLQALFGLEKEQKISIK